MASARLFSRILPPAALCLPALAQVVVTPHLKTIESFSPVALTALVDGKADPTVVWSFPDHAQLQAPGGVFLAPEVAGPTPLVVHATQGGRTGEGTLLVVPATPQWNTMLKVKGTVDPLWSNRLPFFDGATGKRMGDAAKVVELAAVPAGMNFFHLLGTGLPGLVAWDPLFATADALLLSYTEGENLERREVTGQRSTLLTLWDRPQRCMVEGLWRKRGADGAVLWESRMQQIRLKMRGLVPLAGDDVAGHLDGFGREARFQAPCGLLALREGESFVVADPGAGVLRLVYPGTGTVRTLCGAAGQPGHADGPRAVARLRRPTFMANWQRRAFPSLDGPVRVVADSGNHVLRVFDAQGTVTTLAGRPGVKGHKDADNPLEAQFDEPMGLASEHDLCLYVADHGNGVIRRIAPDGKVTTLAGAPRQFGAVDGKGGAARFRDLKGLAITWGKLYVVDGHAIRSVDLEDGEVLTVCGQVDAKGFLNGKADDLKGKACLNEPWGLTASNHSHKLLVADRGNHAIREFRTPGGYQPGLSTLVGAPEARVTNWGLLPDELTGPLPPAYAAVAAPMAVLQWLDSAFVSTGSCLASASGVFGLGDFYLYHDRTPLKLALEDGAEVKAGAPLRVTYGGLTVASRVHVNPEVTVLEHEVHFEFLDPETGKPILPTISGRHLHGNKYAEANVTFDQPGLVQVRVRCVTPNGVTYVDRKTLLVTAK